MLDIEWKILFEVAAVNVAVAEDKLSSVDKFLTPWFNDIRFFCECLK